MVLFHSYCRLHFGHERDDINKVSKNASIQNKFVILPLNLRFGRLPVVFAKLKTFFDTHIIDMHKYTALNKKK